MSKIKVSGQRSPRWAIWERMLIPSKQNEGVTYLARLRLIQTPWFGIYVHNLNEPDYDRDPHDHPWSFLSVIMRGGYTETVYETPWRTTDPDYIWRNYERRWNRWSWHKMTQEKAHQIVSVKPDTISLIIVGKRTSSWGFWTRDGWVDWREYEST